MNEFYSKYFQSNIKANLKKIETFRIKTLIKVFLLFIFYLCLGIIFAIFFFIYNNKSPLFLTFFLFGMNFFIINSIVTIFYENRNFQSKLFQEINPLFYIPIANFIKWPKNQNTEALINSELFSNFDTQEDESSIFGNYKNTNIIISQTQLTLPTNGLENRNLFKGNIIQLEFNKTFNNTILITLKSEKIFTKLKPLKINNNNNNFNVFYTNQNNLDFINEKLFLILENILSNSCANNFKASIKNNTVIIALNKNLPERTGSLFKSVYSQKNYDKLINQFVAIFELIDLLSS